MRLFAFSTTALLSYCANVAWALSTPQQQPCWSSTTGQRYLYVRAAATTTAAPPLLIIPGTAQSIELWQQHVPFFSRTRSVIICEPLGLGLQVPKNVDMDLAAQAETLQKTLTSINIVGDNSGVGIMDIAGFSLGGRIAMALACQYPDVVNRLHLTGVALQRSSWGTLQIDAWKNLLDNDHDDLRPFAWSALLASYAPDFLVGQRDKLPMWIDGVASRHTVAGLRQLIRQTHNEDDDWSVAAMTKRLPPGIKGRLCVGEGDQLAPAEQVQALAKTLAWSPSSVIPRAAHVPPIENPRAWRKDLEDFLNE